MASAARPPAISERPSPMNASANPASSLDGAPEMFDGCRPLLVFTGQLAQHVLGAGIARIDLELFFEFAARFVAAGGGL